MYFTHGLRPNLATLVALVRPFGPVSTAAEVKASFRAMLAALLPQDPIGTGGGIEIVVEGPVYDAVKRIFEVEAEGPPLEDRRRSAARVAEGLARLRELDPDLATLVTLTTEHIVTGTGRSHGSETGAGAIGNLLVEPGRSWSVGDVVEAIVHENTHTLVFLDHLRFGHVEDVAALRAQSAQTSMLGQRRDLGIAVDSLIVAAEIVELRRRLVGEPPAPRLHPPSEAIRVTARDCLASIEAIPDLERITTPRYRALLAKAAERLAAVA